MNASTHTSGVVRFGPFKSSKSTLPSKSEINQKEKEKWKKGITQRISQNSSVSMVTAISFRTFEGRDTLKSYRMRLPICTEFNRTSFTANELEIFGGLDNSKDIILPATKLMVDMKSANLKNTGRIACRELFIRNWGINKSNIETHDNLKIEARQILNVADPVVNKNTGDMNDGNSVV